MATLDLTVEQIDNIGYQVWSEFRDWGSAPHCLRCGLVYQPFQYHRGQQSWLKQCDCDELAHLKQFFGDDWLREIESWNRTWTRTY